MRSRMPVKLCGVNRKMIGSSFDLYRLLDQLEPLRRAAGAALDADGVQAAAQVVHGNREIVDLVNLIDGHGQILVAAGGRRACPAAFHRSAVLGLARLLAGKSASSLVAVIAADVTMFPNR